MKNVKIGFVSLEHIRLADKRGARENELEDSTGWVANKKVHRSKKYTLHRNRKHKGGLQ